MQGPAAVYWLKFKINYSIQVKISPNPETYNIIPFGGYFVGCLVHEMYFYVFLKFAIKSSIFFRKEEGQWPK